MNTLSDFQQFLVSNQVQISLSTFLLDLVLAVLLGGILGLIYRRFGRTLSNRREFARNFVLMTATTMFIITIVKSSLALSLGLVGALSIVRFRAAIKEPEELTYLFFAIAVGLGLGAGQRVVTLCAFAIVAAILVVKGARAVRTEARHLFLTVSGAKGAIGPDAVIDELRAGAVLAHLTRLDEDETSFEMSLEVDFDDYSQFSAVKDRVLGLSGDLRLSLLDNRGLSQ